MSEDKHILLVEDNEMKLDLAIELLQDVGADVTIARNGLEALNQVDSSTFDCVLMDIQMPEMDGLTATQKIRQNEQHKRLPILAMTAHAMKGEAEKSLAAGMNEHITKPIDPFVLDGLYKKLFFRFPYYQFTNALLKISSINCVLIILINSLSTSGKFLVPGKSAYLVKVYSKLFASSFLLVYFTLTDMLNLF